MKNEGISAAKVNVKSQDLDSFRYITVVRSHRLLFSSSLYPLFDQCLLPLHLTQEPDLLHACLRLQLATALIKQVVQFSSVQSLSYV